MKNLWAAGIFLEDDLLLDVLRLDSNDCTNHQDQLLCFIKTEEINQ